MSNEPEIGELSQKGVTVECAIKDLLSYKKTDAFYLSPRFSAQGFDWCLSIWPNGQTKNVSAGWISLYLQLLSHSAGPIVTDFTFGVKSADGTIKQIESPLNFAFEKMKTYGYHRFMERSRVSGVLTVVCTLKVRDSPECINDLSMPGLSKLSENLKDLFISERGCDVTLKVKQEQFSAHKSILMARSPVLAAMFEVDMKEKETGVVDILDCHPKAFKDFLTYLYSGVYQNHSNEVLELYSIADKYDVEDLKSACVQHILSNLSIDNLFEAVLIAHHFDESELSTKTQDFFDKNLSEILSAPKWLSFLKENLTLGNELLKNMAVKRNSEK